MLDCKLFCKKCKYFQERQGKGKLGDCRLFPRSVEKKPTDWCGCAEVNLEKYHVSGKKIYTRIDTVQVK